MPAHTRLHGHAVAKSGCSCPQLPAAVSGPLCADEMHSALPQRRRKQKATTVADSAGRAARQVAKLRVRGRRLMRPSAVLHASAAQLEPGSERRGHARTGDCHHCCLQGQCPAMRRDQQVGTAIADQWDCMLYPPADDAVLPQPMWQRRFSRAAGSRGDRLAAASGGAGANSGVAGNLPIGGRHNHIGTASCADQAAI